MAELISVPLKKPTDVDLVKPLKNLIESNFSNSDTPTRCQEQLQELNKMRSTAIWKVFDKYDESLDIIYSYCDQLTSLEGKIPAQEVQIPFKWKDAFDKGSIFGARMSLTVSSLSFERVCILFNIASLQSSVAAAQSITSDDGLKLSAKLFQQAAGIYEYLKGAVPIAVHQETTRDLNSDTLEMLQQLMVAQAQEIFVLKAIHDGMKEAIVAKLACQCEYLYSEVAKSLQKEALKSVVEKEWINTAMGKVSAYGAIAQFFQSLISKANKEIGPEITRLNKAIELFKSAQSTTGNPTFMQQHLNKAEINLAEANKDNDFIYFAKIPAFNQLEPIGKALLAKPTPLPAKWSSKSNDLFQELMPVSIHQALVAYDVRKSEIVNVEINKLRESTQTLNSILASLNLPASIEQTKGNELPQSILEKAESVKNSGGIEGLQGLMRELPDLLQRNRDILNEAERMLREEKESDDQLRAQFKEKWERTPSEKLTAIFSQNLDKYKTVIENAMSADRTIHDTFANHQEGIELLSRSASDLQANVPSGSGAVGNSSAVMTLRKLMEDVETIKVERDVIESELKSATQDMKAVFLSALAKDGAISEPALSVTSLGEIFGPLQKQVAENISRQEELIQKIQEANTVFEAEQGGHGGGREAKFRQLATSFDGYNTLLTNLKDGIKFYNDLTQILISCQSKIGDYCFARKTEKEELMKHLTQESSRGSLPAPTPPQYHNVAPTEPKKDPPPRPSQPPATAAAAGSLPYPMSSQGSMPVPYGPPGGVPYPTFMPPPQMPQGYNPYSMPYPSSGAYSGFPQAPPFQNVPLQYPQGGPPQYPGMQYPPQGMQPNQQGMPQYPQQQYPQYQQPPGW